MYKATCLLTKLFLGIKLSKNARSLDVEYGQNPRVKWLDSCSSNQTSDSYIVTLPKEIGRMFTMEIQFCQSKMSFNWFNIIVIWEWHLRGFWVVPQYIAGQNCWLFKRRNLRIEEICVVHLQKCQFRRYSTLCERQSAKQCSSGQYFYQSRSE